MSWLVVTPARNEAERLPKLAQSLARQSVRAVGTWVVIDDGSTDDTAASLPDNLPFPVHVIRRDNSGGLSGASDFAAFLYGADEGLRLLPEARRVMKLDADIELADDYFAALVDTPDEVGLVAGELTDIAVPVRAGHTRGALKAYSRDAFTLVRKLPVALGWDVMDEVAVRVSGLRVEVVPAARATSNRRTGASEGLLVGHHRAGVVSRWTGYAPVYFTLRLLRYAPRRPPLVGSVVMLWSWLTAGPGPYDARLRAAKRAEQLAALRGALNVRAAARFRRTAPASAAPKPPSQAA